MAVRQPQQQPAVGHTTLSQGFSPPAATHAQQQGTSTLALVNQQLAAQVALVVHGDQAHLQNVSMTPWSSVGTTRPASMALQGSRLHLDDRGALWLLPVAAAAPGAGQGGAVPPTQHGASLLQRNDPTAAAPPALQAKRQPIHPLGPADTQRIATAAARAAAAAAAPYGQTGVPQSITAAAAIIESGSLPPQVPLAPYGNSACLCIHLHPWTHWSTRAKSCCVDGCPLRFRNTFTSGRHAPRVQAKCDADGWGQPLHEALAAPGQNFGLCSRDVGDPGGPWCVSHCAVGVQD